MSTAYRDQRNATIRRYLLRELARMKLSGNQYSILMIIMDETYGWKRPDQPKYTQRLDRNSFSFSLFEEELGASESSVSRSMRDLIKRKIVTRYEAPTKTKDGVYGINSEVSEWVKKDNIGRQKSLGKSGLGGQKSPGKSVIGGQKSLGKKAKKPTNNPAKPLSTRDCGRLIYSFNKIPPTPQGESAVEFVQISDPKIANNSELTNREAVTQAEKNFFQNFGTPLSPRQRDKVSEKMELGRPGAVLAIWILAINLTVTERKQARAEQKKTWKHIFSHVEDCFGRIYEEKKNGKARPRQSAPSFWDNPNYKNDDDDDERKTA